jgi:uncharacterized protein YndB with AHSA1/START domain
LHITAPARQEAGMLDAIVREITLPVSPEEAWEALTESDRLEDWFADEAELDPVPGGAATFTWEGEGTRRAVVEEVEEGRRLAFRWEEEPGEAPGQAGPGTRVEFTLLPVPEGTRLLVRETGFALAAPRVTALAASFRALALA